MAFIRPVDAFRTLLLSKAAITALVADRVYGAPGVPRSLVASMPTKAITIAQTGGTDNPSIPLTTARLDIRCYGETLYQADVLYSTVAEELGFMAAPIEGRRLQNELIVYGADNVYLYAVHKVSGPYDTLEMDEEWPCVWAAVSFLHFQKVASEL